MSSRPIEISRKAKFDVARTLAFLGGHSPMAAARLSEELERAILTLGQFPLMGRLRPEFGPNLRSVTVSQQLIIYRHEATLVLILRVLDGRMDVETEIQNDRAP